MRNEREPAGHQKEVSEVFQVEGMSSERPEGGKSCVLRN